MHAMVYHGPGSSAWEQVPDPVIQVDTDAIVRVDAVPICGTDLQILKGDVPVDTSSIPTLIELIRSGRLDSSGLVTHRFGMSEFPLAYEVFEHPGDSGALKVVLFRNEETGSES
ncbi:threonine dehydrogenase-like Zn-dependent dehydrogenase [Nocardia sp. GAS34]